MAKKTPPRSNQESTKSKLDLIGVTKKPKPQSKKAATKKGQRRVVKPMGH